MRYNSARGATRGELHRPSRDQGAVPEMRDPRDGRRSAAPSPGTRDEHVLAPSSALARPLAPGDKLASEPAYLYLAEVMNWPNDSHQTITVLKRSSSVGSGTGTRKFLNVLMSPTRTMRGFRRLNSASVSTNSGDK